MSGRTIGALIVAGETERVSRIILDAFTAAGANLRATYEAIGCSKASLWRWIEQLGLRAKIDEIQRSAKAEGWIVRKKADPKALAAGGRKGMASRWGKKRRAKRKAAAA